MARLALVIACSGCTFTPASRATATDDAAAPDDVPALVIDAQAQIATCQLGVEDITGFDRGRVGGDGGSANFPPLACDSPLERIVGIALKMSDQDTVFGGRSAHALFIACAPVTIAADGTARVGAATLKELTGAGDAQFRWTPSTMTPVTRCPDGAVVAGIAAHRGPGNNRFLDVRITCAQLGFDGTVKATQVLPVTGSLTEPQNDDAVDCNDDEVLVRLPNRTGQGIDAVNLSCAKPACT